MVRITREQSWLPSQNIDKRCKFDQDNKSSHVRIQDWEFSRTPAHAVIVCRPGQLAFQDRPKYFWVQQKKKAVASRNEILACQARTTQESIKTESHQLSFSCILNPDIERYRLLTRPQYNTMQRKSHGDILFSGTRFWGSWGTAPTAQYGRQSTEKLEKWLVISPPAFLRISPNSPNI